MSMKTITHFTNFYLSSITMFWDIVQNYLNHSFASIFKVFASFPSEILKDVKNLRLYLECLDTLRNLMHFVNFIFKRTSRTLQTVDIFVEKFPILFQSQFNLLKNMPHVGTVQIRKDILSYMK